MKSIVKLFVCLATSFALLADPGTPIVDMDAGELRFYAETTGVGPGGIAEFYIITQNSGHDYEALFLSRAKAEDITAGIAKLGLSVGEAADPGKFRFWAKGERVNMFVKFPDREERVPLDSLVVDKRAGKPITPAGFVFVGAKVPDNMGPGSIVPSYNEEMTVFDVPRSCRQDEVYGNFTAAAGFPAEKGLVVEIIMKPETRPADSPRRVMELEAAFSPEGVAIGGAAPVPAREAVVKFRALAKAGHDVFVTPLWDDKLTMAQVRDCAKVLRMLDTDDGIRVAPPAAGDPYYRAFDPPERWRERADRFSQPCELRFAQDGTATLVTIVEVWKDDQINPDLNPTEHPGVTVDTLPQAVEGRDNNLKVLFVYAPAKLAYGALRPFVEAMKPTHPEFHIYVEK